MSRIPASQSFCRVPVRAKNAKIFLILEMINAWVCEHQSHSEIGPEDMDTLAQGVFLLTGEAVKALASDDPEAIIRPVP